MSADIYQRLAAVETRLSSIEEVQGSMAADLRVVRDHMIADASVRKAFKRFLSISISILAVVGAAWKILKGVPPELVG